MSRYIDADVFDKLLESRELWLLNEVHDSGTAGAVKGVRNLLKVQPTADVAPVIHATWEGDPPRCTHCGCNPEDFFHTEGFCSPIMNYGVDDEAVRFCPGCGAIWKEVNEDD